MIDWISVEKELPDHEEIVLVYCKMAPDSWGYAVVIFLVGEEINKELEKQGIEEREELPYLFCSAEVKGNALNKVSHWARLKAPDSIHLH